MKIAVCSKGEGLEALVDERFGRADKFVIVDTETKAVKTVENTAKDAGVGAGGQSVRILEEENIEVVLVPEVGPKAVDALKAFEITAYLLGESKTVEEALKNYEQEKLKKFQAPVVKGGLRKV